MMIYHFALTSSLRIKNFKIDKYGDFSSDIDFHSRTDIFRDAISLIINQCDFRRPKGVSASRAAQASEARLFLLFINQNIFNVLCLSFESTVTDGFLTRNYKKRLYSDLISN